jgi:succinate dehydrogenase/fumarate reductase flavoprotein subunit
MTKGHVIIRGTRLPLYSLNTLVIGSGAASLNAAVRLHEFGQTDVAVATDRFGGGTSRNAGSDKQTYYKLSLAGSEPDSPLRMAEDLFAGGCMHGDIALCEALGSVQAFFHLVGLGVPFPHDRFGAFAGYKTDHDPRQRATSAGPLTSRLMFEALAREVERRGIPVLDGLQAIALLTAGKGRDKRVIGALAIDRRSRDRRRPRFVLFNAVNIVLGTGGPGGMYRDSVYPEDQVGSHGLAFAAGAVAHNLTESQFGLASVKFRWNLSGTYQQVVPRYFSTDGRGGDEREFLNEDFPDMGQLATAIFKGLSMAVRPAEGRRLRAPRSSTSSSTARPWSGPPGFLDYQRNPARPFKFRARLLAPEAASYLERSGACQATPIARLRHMNRPAIDLFLRHGIDLAREPLEGAVCAQHNNGGFKGDVWWESTTRHLFPVGEVNGTHGVYRPGGSALNAGQVGSFRAALFIAKRSAQKPPAAASFVRSARGQAEAVLDQATRMVRPGRKGTSRLKEGLAEIRERMSAWAAHVRRPEDVRRETGRAWDLVRRLPRDLDGLAVRELPAAFRLLDLALTHAMYLTALDEYLKRGGRSRGSYLVLDPEGEKPCATLEDSWRFALAKPDDFVSRQVLEVRLDRRSRPRIAWTDIRPVPTGDDWFETVWAAFRADGVVRKEERR